MANVGAIRSTGFSLVTYLNRAYQAAEHTFPDGVMHPNCTFSHMSIGEFRKDHKDLDVPANSAVVPVLLYRVNMNEHMRTAGRPANPDMNPPPLSVDLHFLLTFLADGAEIEQIVLAWTLRQMHQTPILDGSILGSEAGWAPDDVIQLIPEEISNEDLMRIWDALEPHYHLSLSYIARVVRIDPDETRDHVRVAATRFDYAVPTPGS